MMHNINPFKEYALIDLTHMLDESVPTWTGRCGFKHEIRLDYDMSGIRVLKYHMQAGIGTHMDAPTHFVREGKNIVDISLEDLFAPICLIDVTKKMHPLLFIGGEEIREYEKAHGMIQPGSLVIGYTGWQKYWSDPEKYRNPDKEGNMHFPGFSKEAAEMLIERNIVGIGIDTLSPDGSNTREFPVHHTILGAGKYILENLTELNRVPPRGAYGIVLPLKVKVGTEAAVRAICLVKKNEMRFKEK